MFHYLWEKLTLNKFFSIQKNILILSSKYSVLSEEELKEEAKSIQEKINYEKLELNYEFEKLSAKFLNQVYALTREVIFRKTGLLLFPTQVFGGIVLHNGNIAQMNTGEGKTLTAILPVCLNALVGNYVYVVTTNEYLANRDWEIAKPFFDFFEIPSFVNLSTCGKDEKKDFYEKSRIVYTTGSQIAFDYLRNNLIKDKNNKLNMKFDYVLIDEVDSILIDEAQNPLIISNNSLNNESDKNEKDKYYSSIGIVKKLKKDIDYQTDDKEKSVWLTDLGIRKVENFYGIDNLYDFSNQENVFFIFNCLKAVCFYRKGIEYVVDKEKNRISIIDSNTGRIAYQRHYESGLHQSIEAKENLPITPRGIITATITYQNFFRLFKKISGMTGTAKSEADEFREVYGMEVIEIKPYKKLIRKDKHDIFFLNKRKKYEAVIKLIKDNYRNEKRPILIGSPNLESSEYLSSLLNLLRIKHSKLNALSHREEAKIIAKAGEIGSITISTNMAGRGTDIILTPESIEKGGLILIGLGRNFKRRIDDQLKGRAGRQGNPGETQFYVSFDDELLKNFSLSDFVSNYIVSENTKLFDNLISSPQETLRNLSYMSRQHTLNYDLLINKKREIVYKYRQDILESDDFFLSLFEYNMNNDFKEMINNYPAIAKNIQNKIGRNLVSKIDNFWSGYLESLEKIRRMLTVKIYLPKDPQESFFSESNDVFEKNYLILKSNFKEIVCKILE